MIIYTNNNNNDKFVCKQTVYIQYPCKVPQQELYLLQNILGTTNDKYADC